MKRQWWQLPRLHTAPERKVTWLELFFDLVFVALIAVLAHKLVGDASLKAVGGFAFLFLPAWWAWVGMTYYMDRFETFGIENRLIFFVSMLCVVGMAAFAHHALDDSSAGYALSYAGARGIIVVLWGRAAVHNPPFRKVGIRLTAGFGLSVAIFAVSVFFPTPLRFWLWGVALVVDLLTPLTIRSLLRDQPAFTAHKLQERFGLFVIIVLGESVLGVINGLAKEHHISFAVGVEVAAGLALAFALWWIYFDFVGRRPPRGDHPNLSMAWAYLHMPLVMGIVCIGASLTGVMAEHGDVVSPERTRLVAASIAVALLSIGLIELVLDRSEDEPTTICGARP